MVVRHGDLFGPITSPANFILAYVKARRGKAYQRGVREFADGWEEKLEELRVSVRDKTFTTSSYRRMTIQEPKRRDIYSLRFSDRIVHHGAMTILGPIWTEMFISESYACIKGRGQHSASKRCAAFTRRNEFVLMCDIAKFYQSMVHATLKAIIRRKVKCRDTLWLLDDIIDSFPGGVGCPIGNLTSQWFGNVYLHELDLFVKHALGVRDYQRYCDDFLLFGDSKEQLRAWRSAIEAFCRDRLGLVYSKAEVAPVRHGVDYLGYRHFPDGHILLRKSTARRMARKMRSLDDADVTDEYRRSYVAAVYGWTKHANTHNFARAIGLPERMAAYGMRV